MGLTSQDVVDVSVLDQHDALDQQHNTDFINVKSPGIEKLLILMYMY
jgi:hypothetical protein